MRLPSFIYRSERVGLNGRAFSLYFLRCVRCGNERKISPCEIESAKYCSWDCRAKSVGEGRIGARNNKWKDSSVGYGALHDWVSRRLGKPRTCAHCKSSSKKKYEWANVSGSYKRDVTDYIRLCTSCHRYMDGHGEKAAGKAWETRKSRYGHCGRPI